jgi:acetyl esterase/lipase
MKTMQLLLSMAFLLLVVIGNSAEAQPTIPIWGDSDPPWSLPHSLQEYEEKCWGGATCVYQVVNPTLTLFLPARQANGAVVVVLPGGGYEVEAIYHEGYEIARLLAEQGSVAAVLKYRLPNPGSASVPELVPGADVRQALRLLRERQSGLGFTGSRFGVLGFSAGGHLAASVSVHRSEESAENPDFSILVYGVSRMNAENREWLERTLYHRRMTEDEVTYQTLHERVDAATPPAFLVHAFDDDTCHYSESTLYAEALQRNGVDAELHLFARGGHGFGPGRDEDGTSQWVNLAVRWLERLGAEQLE